MKFFKVIATCFRKYVSVAGTSSRSEFLYWFLFVVLILGIANIIDGVFIAPALGFLPFEEDAGEPLSLITLLLLIPPTVSVAARRLHDSAISGYWLFIALTVVGLLPLFYLFVKSGKKSGNPYKEA